MRQKGIRSTTGPVKEHCSSLVLSEDDVYSSLTDVRVGITTHYLQVDRDESQ